MAERMDGCDFQIMFQALRFHVSASETRGINNGPISLSEKVVDSHVARDPVYRPNEGPRSIAHS